MKKIAVFSKGTPDGSRELANVLNNGTRYRIITHIIISEHEGSQPETLLQDNIELLSFTPADCVSDTSRLPRLLDERKVDLLLIDGADKELIATLLPEYAGRIIDLAETGIDPQSPDYTRKILTILEQSDLEDADRRWADVLGLDYDSTKAAATTQLPPIPESPVVGPELPPIPATSIPSAPPAPAPLFGDRNANPYHKVAPTPATEEAMPDTFLIWSVLATVFCCLIPGIVAIIYSSMVSSRFYARDYAGAKRASRLAEIWIIVSIVLGVITASVYLPIMLFT